METNDKCGIYEIKCGPTGKIYIGSSSRIYRRWYEHRRRLNLGKHHAPILQRAWNRHGESAFYFSVLEECAREALVDREQHYIDMLQPIFNTLLNVDRGLAEFNKARFALITHCPKGHTYDDANTMIHQGKRVCRKCNAERVAGIYATETPEQRETRRIRATAQAQREKDQEARRQYALAHKTEKKAYDAARAAEKAVKDRERRSDRTPEQIEAVNAGKRAYYAANRERAQAQLRASYRRRQERKLAPA